jgi:hypothetical protein
MTETFIGPLDNVALSTGERASWLMSLLHWVRRHGFIGAAYIAGTFATRANSMADTVDYVESITLFERGVNHWMWDFAHLFWRPLGWILSFVFAPVTALFVGENDRLNVLLTLTSVSWLAGLLCVVLIHALVGRLTGRTWVANAVALALIFTHGFLNFAQAGTSYILGMALLLSGLYLLVATEAPILAGAALAAAVCLWVPYVLAIPAAVLAPLFLVRFDGARARLALHTAVAFAFFTGVAYLAVMVGLRLHTVDEIRSWIAWSSHGTDFGGAKRVIFGFARTFIDMGNDGLLFKRYLLSDPFNPVSLRDLVVGSLWKLGIFYLFVASVVVSLFYSPQSRRVLALLLVNSIPVIGFAVFFAGSDMERYFAVYPLLFLAIASCLANRSPRILKSFVVVFIALMILVNSTAMARSVLDRKQDTAASRIRDLLPRIDRRTLVLVANWQDDLINFTRAYPFHPINRSGRLHVNALVTPGTSWNLHWREDFASNVLSRWSEGGAVWISRRILSPRPRAEWNWTEGDDRRVSWKDFPTLLSHLDLGESVGGADGFALLLRSPKNEQFLRSLAPKEVKRP